MPSPNGTQRGGGSGYDRPARPRALRTLLLACCAYGCTDAVHTVGQLEDAPAPAAATNAGRNAGGSAGGGDQGSGSDTQGGGAASASSSGGNGAAPTGTAAGSGPTEPFDAAVISDPDVSCEGSTEDAVREPLNLYLVVDRSLTLAVPWGQITDGIQQYAEDPAAAGTGVGVKYFPALDAAQPMCDPGTYARPDTMIAELPGNAAAIKAGIPIPMVGFTGSPTSAALTGSLDHAASRANGFGVPHAVVLITDAVQDFVCFTEPRELESAAAAARNGTAAVRTYVVALTVPELQSVLELIRLAPLDNLDKVASSGGTGEAREVSLNLASGIASTIAGTLLQIQHDAEPCRYEVPQQVRDAIAAGTGDSGTTVLGTTAGSETPAALPQLGAMQQCGQGYYLDDPAAPQWATLCNETCAVVKSGGRRVLWLTECR